MLDGDGVAMYIDSIRVYQTQNHDAHVGQAHSLGCDPPEYPTKEWIVGHEYRYMRNPPFVFDDKKPLRFPIQRGGGACVTNDDCGANVANNVNWTLVYEQQKHQQQKRKSDNPEQQQQDDMGDDAVRRLIESSSSQQGPGRGRCDLAGSSSSSSAATTTTASFMSSIFSNPNKNKNNNKNADGSTSVGVCSCNNGFTGPHCLSIDHIDDSPSAYELHMKDSPFHHVFHFRIPTFLSITLGLLCVVFCTSWSRQVWHEKQAKQLRARTAFLAANHYKTKAPSSAAAASIPPHAIINKNRYNKNNIIGNSEEQQSLLPRPLQVGAVTTTTTTVTAADNLSGITDSSV
jgi:hypothetical protein